MGKGTLQTLDRGLTVMALVASEPSGVKIGDLALRAGLTRAAAYRIVATLTEHAMVRRSTEGRITLGTGAYLLGAQAAGGIQRIARPVLQALAERVGATAFLSMLQGEDCVVALTAEPSNAFLNIHYKVGTRHSVHRGAAGIAILASRPEAPDDPESVRLARATGYSVTVGQLHPNAVGVSSPVVRPGIDAQGTRFSVGVVALTDLETGPAAEAVKTAAAALAEGFR